MWKQWKKFSFFFEKQKQKLWNNRQFFWLELWTISNTIRCSRSLLDDNCLYVAQIGNWVPFMPFHNKFQRCKSIFARQNICFFYRNIKKFYILKHFQNTLLVHILQSTSTATMFTQLTPVLVYGRPGGPGTPALPGTPGAPGEPWNIHKKIEWGGMKICCRNSSLKTMQEKKGDTKEFEFGKNKLRAACESLFAKLQVIFSTTQ